MLRVVFQGDFHCESTTYTCKLYVRLAKNNNNVLNMYMHLTFLGFVAIRARDGNYSNYFPVVLHACCTLEALSSDQPTYADN